mmetsp:Transcript_88193/g.175144  ORF Transcript_88193/g.175144 Transcript_88193/m.175144 type:complete len:303 (+) Transcript_88193:63-971(+)|eukprot:CAMPEP_0172727880 /NCGR_PEP_ID=MMETSP1074-20121228/91922_1 /TAXON_ID=2916 /ORGANISM="Ceratium fusus, Strain PA161109" /LENGTH=302 /DNA_ID=CAMNT_0013555067 /DNA_START=63 /DNA_END=971 /DNA_ORIENTATION=+
MSLHSEVLHWLAGTVRKLDKILHQLQAADVAALSQQQLQQQNPEPVTLRLNELIPVELPWHPDPTAQEFFPTALQPLEATGLHVADVDMEVTASAPLVPMSLATSGRDTYKFLPSVGTWLAFAPVLQVSTPPETQALETEPTQENLIQAFREHDYIRCSALIAQSKELCDSWKAITPHLVLERDAEVQLAREQHALAVDKLASMQSNLSELRSRASVASETTDRRKEASQLLREIEKMMADFRVQKQELEQEIRSRHRTLLRLELTRRLFIDLMEAVPAGDVNAIESSSSQFKRVIQDNNST